MHVECPIAHFIKRNPAQPFWGMAGLGTGPTLLLSIKHPVGEGLCPLPFFGSTLFSEGGVAHPNASGGRRVGFC